MTVTTPCASIDRLTSRLDALAAIGATEDGGVSRLALTDADKAARDLVCSWMKDLGLRIDVDAIGNVVATWPPDRHDPAVMMGSHIDTVVNGGRLDGNLGVLAGLEVIETVSESGVDVVHPLAVGFFTNEEGSRFPPDMLGSLVYVGGLDLDDALATVAIDGAVLGDELARIGYDGPHRCPARPPRAYVELHVEQGPVLVNKSVTIGAVTGVQGISWQEVTVAGEANHAGTTPMAARHDAGLAAARLTVAVGQLTSDMDGNQVGTVGRFGVEPDLVNVVPSHARFTIDLRNTDGDRLREAELRFEQACRAVESDLGVSVSARSLANFAPVEFDPTVIDLVEDTASQLGYLVQRLPAGAGHDAQMLARVCPAGMIFVPSVGGVSHSPAEHTDTDDVAAGATVLLHVVLALAGATAAPS